MTTIDKTADVQIFRSGAARAGDYIKRRREELGLTQRDLALRCKKWLQAHGLADRKITPNRLAKLEGAAQPCPPISSASQLRDWERQALAAALGAPEEVIAGFDSNIAAFWDPTMEPAIADHIFALMAEAEREVEEILTWDKCLPCSLVTQEVMHAQHLAIHSARLPTEYVDSAVKSFDAVGNRRRERFLDVRREKRPRVCQLIFRTDIEKVAFGLEEYSLCGFRDRIACLSNLRSMISNENLKLTLCVSEPERLSARTRKSLLDRDSVLVFGKRLVVWRDSSASLYLTSNRTVVMSYYDALREFRDASSYNTRAATGLLAELIRAASDAT